MDPSLLQTTLFDDVIRYTHLLAIIVGLGASFIADATVFRHLKAPLSAEFLSNLHWLHCIVNLALWGMWISGAVLIYLRTGFVLDNFSPKLIAKVVVVSVLTLNSLLISRYAMPKLALKTREAPLDFSKRLKLPLAMIAGFSTTSWLLALALGSSAVLKQSGAEVQVALLAGSYLMSVLCGFVAVAIVRPAAKSVAVKQG